MRLLLDTHALIWALLADPRLSATAEARIVEPDNEVLVSAASAWELAIKAALGKLPPAAADHGRLAGWIEKSRFGTLPVTIGHALATRDLPRHHSDPFDRLLIAQAQLEGLAIVTRDTWFAAYGVSVVW